MKLAELNRQLEVIRDMKQEQQPVDPTPKPMSDLRTDPISMSTERVMNQHMKSFIRSVSGNDPDVTPNKQSERLRAKPRFEDDRKRVSVSVASNNPPRKSVMGRPEIRHTTNSAYSGSDNLASAFRKERSQAKKLISSRESKTEFNLEMHHNDGFESESQV